MRTFVAAVISLLGLFGCTNGALDQQIADRKAKIEQLSAQLVSAASWLNQDKDLAAELRYKAVAKYLTEITTPSLDVNATGTSAPGDVWYKGGFGKAWIGPPGDAQMRLSLTGMSIDGSNSGINWHAHMTAHAQVRLQGDVLRMRPNVLCGGDAGTDAAGIVALSSSDSAQANYSIAVTSPGTLPVDVGCGLGMLGTIHVGFNVGGIAREVAKGLLPLGVEQQGAFDVPQTAPKQRIQYSIAFKDVALVTRPEGLEYRANGDVRLTH